MKNFFLPRQFGRLLLTVAIVLAFASGVSAQTTTPTPWLHKKQHGDIVYFAFASRIERYDLSTEQWLTSIALTSSPGAFHVDAGGMYLAHGRVVYTRAIDGTAETPIYTARYSVTGLNSDPNLLFVHQNSSSILESVRKSDKQFVAGISFGSSSTGSGLIVARTERRLYAADGSGIDEVTYTAEGGFGTVRSVYGSSYDGGNLLVLRPDERILFQGNGSMYSVPNAGYRVAVGVASDAAYHGQDVLVTLRGDKLFAVDSTARETGLYTLTAASQAMTLRAGQVYVFRASASAAAGIEVEKVAYTSISAEQPGAPKDPAAYTFVPDEIQQMEDGSLLFLCKALRSIFKWSPSTGRYTASYPLIGSPSSFAYSPVLKRIFTVYQNGVYQILLGDGATTETVFLSQSQERLIKAADEYLLINNGSYPTYTNVYDRQGALVSATSVELSQYSCVWSSSQRRLYYYRYYSALGHATLSPAGVFGTPVISTASINSFTVGPWVSADGATLLTANGHVYRTSDLQYSAALANAVLDAVPHATSWATIRAGGADTQLQFWSTTLFFDRGLTIPGVPYRLFSLSDGKLLVLSTTGGNDNYSPRNSGALIFSVVDPAGAGTIGTSPFITGDLVNTTIYKDRPGSLTVTASGSSLTYEWRKNGAVIADATGATLSFDSAKGSDQATYSVSVSNAYGFVMSKSVTVTVVPAPAAPTITTQPRGGHVSLGSYVSFHVYTTGTSLAYQWRKDGTNIPFATSSSLYISNLKQSDIGTYDVVVSSPGGSVTSEPAMIELSTPPTITAQPTDQTTNLYGTVTFSVAASGVPAPTYRWQRGYVGSDYVTDIINSGVYSGANTSTLTITGATQSMNGYLFRAVVSNGTSIASASATLHVTNAPKINSSSRATFIAGQSNSFIVKAYGTPPPTFSATGLPSWAALDSVTGVLSGTPPSTAQSPFAITLRASNGSLPDDEQPFILSVQSTAGAPRITTDPAGLSVGAGGNATFSVRATGVEPMTYQWSKNGAAISGATASTFSITNATVSEAGRYSVRVTNAEGSADSRAAVLSVVPDGVGATHRVLGAGGFVPGGAVTVSTTIAYPGTARALGCQVLLPEGWSFVSAAGSQGETKPAAGTSNLLEWAWTSEPVGPVTFTYTLNVPSSETADRQLATLVTLRTGDSPILVLGLPDPLIVRRLTTHSADTDGNNRISLFELTRVVELYNTRNSSERTGCYGYDPSGEDGFNPEPTRSRTSTVTLPSYHSADSNRDGKISLAELTRVIELFNHRVGTTRTGEYRVLVGSEDGFASGAAASQQPAAPVTPIDPGIIVMPSS